MAPGVKRRSDSDTEYAGKRLRRASLPTPPSSDLSSPSPEGLTNNDQADLLDRAGYILDVQVTALSFMSRLYQTDPCTRAALNAAIDAILSSQRAGGKLVFCAVGKSAHIARKLSATCKSMGIRTSFLHACEAMHGDLGDVQDEDVVLFVSFSGRTPELIKLLPHLPEACSIVVMSGHLHPSDCMLLCERPDGILLPTPIHESEECSFGICAPTTSTVVTLAVGDMLSLTIAHSLHGKDTKDIFRRNHPGGAIGMKHSQDDSLPSLKINDKLDPAFLGECNDD